MRSSVVFFILLAALSAVQAQESSKLLLDLERDQKVILKMKFANMIQVESWDKNEVLVEAEININDGKLNHAHKMHHAVDNNIITIIADLDNDILSSSHAVNCYDSGASYYAFDDSKEAEQYRLCSNIKYIVHLPADSELELETITGDVTVADMRSAVDVRSVTGTIEFTIPPSQNADIYLKSVMGKVSSDPELTSPSEKMQRLISREIKTQLNGGGNSVHLESVIGNVILRSLN